MPIMVTQRSQEMLLKLQFPFFVNTNNDVINFQFIGPDIEFQNI